MKLLLLKAGVADVPIILQELEQATSSESASDAEVGMLLRRPVVWLLDPSGTLAWHWRRFQLLLNRPDPLSALALLHSACHARGAAVGISDASAQEKTLGELLTGSLLDANDPAITPELLAASWYAAGELDPASRPDPLPEAIRHLQALLHPDCRTRNTAQFIFGLFSQTSPSDRQTVRSLVFQHR